MDPNPIVDKIKKLLAVDPAKGATQAEAEQALMAAQRLALKNNIDLATIDTTQDTSAGEPIIHQPWTPTREGGGECAARLPTCHKFITWILESYFSVRIIEVTQWGAYEDKGVIKSGRRKSLSIIGRQTNVQIAIYVYGFLHREFMDLWHAHKKETGASMGSRNSFFYGLYIGLNDKMQREKGRAEMEVQAELSHANHGKSYEMVLIGEKEKVDQRVKEAHPRLVYTSTSEGPINDYSSVIEGTRQGRDITIHTALK